MIYPRNPYCPMADDCNCHHTNPDNSNTGNNPNNPNPMWPDKTYCPGSNMGNNNNNSNNNNHNHNNNNGNNNHTDCDCGNSGSKDELLRRISELDFAITDLNLYLDTHPDCAEALEMLTKLSATCKSLKADYVKRYGPLMVTDVENETPFSWVSPEHKWPWQM